MTKKEVNKEINDILFKFQKSEMCAGETANNLLRLFFSYNETPKYSEKEVDFAYLAGVFNTSGIDGLHEEIQRLKRLGIEPHDIFALKEKHDNS